MGLCEKIKVKKVLADQIFIVQDDFPDCDLPFAVSSCRDASASISGNLDVTLTDCDVILPTIATDPIQISISLMYQKELTVSGTSSVSPVFVPEDLPNSFPLEFAKEVRHTLAFCNITPSGLMNLGVDPKDVECQLVRIVNVADELEFDCGMTGGCPDDFTITTSAHIENTITTILKFKLEVEEQIFVALCPKNHSFIKPIPTTFCT